MLFVLALPPPRPLDGHHSKKIMRHGGMASGDARSGGYIDVQLGGAIFLGGGRGTHRVLLQSGKTALPLDALRTKHARLVF